MEDRHMQGYLKKKNLRSGLWTPFWVEHDILHGDINYFTDNPVLGPHLSRLRGHFSLDGATFEARVNKHNTPQLVINRKSGIPVKWKAQSLEQAEAWVRHLVATREVPNTLAFMLTEWKKNKDLVRCVAKNEEEMETQARKDFNIAVDFDDDDFDPTLDMPGLTLVDTDGKRVRVDTIIDSRLGAIFMVRSWGCVMSKVLAAKILEKVAQFEEIGAQLVVVAAGNPEAAQKWKKETGFPGSVFCDTDNVLVKTFSCKRGYKYLLSPRSLSSVQKALSDGYRPGSVDAENSFLGGALVYGKKAGIVFQHLERNLGDHADLDQVILSVKRYQRDHPDRTWGPLSYLDLGIFHTQAIASSDGIAKPYHFERGTKTVANDDLPRLLDLALYTRMFQTREHSIWIRKLPDDYDVDVSDDPYGAVVIALLKEPNGDWTTLVLSRIGVRRRVVFAYRDLSEKDCVKFLVNSEVVVAQSLLPTLAHLATWSEEKKELPVVKMRKTSGFAQVRTELIKWEAKERQAGYKFGVLLARPGETTEEEMYNSSSTTPLFESFLSILGDRIDLAGYSGYTGGLDTKGGRTGEQTLMTHIDETDVIFHVATMIPATTSEGTIAKKRHIGNDMGIIIFKEGDEQIDVGAFRSQFNHFFIVVRPIMDSATNEVDALGQNSPQTSLAPSPDSTPRTTLATVNGTTVTAASTSTPTLKFSIEVISKKGVPPAPPFLIENTHFELGPYMRQWILTKLLNLERLAQETVPIFRGKLEKVRALAMWEVTQVANGKKAASDAPAVPAPEPAAPVVVTARRGSLLKKSGALDNTRLPLPITVITSSNTSGTNSPGPLSPTSPTSPLSPSSSSNSISSPPGSITSSTTTNTSTPPSSLSSNGTLGTMAAAPGSLTNVLNSTNSNSAPNSLNFGPAPPMPQVPVFPRPQQQVIVTEKASRKNSNPQPVGKDLKEPKRSSDPKTPKDKKKDKEAKAKRLRSGSMVEDSSKQSLKKETVPTATFGTTTVITSPIITSRPSTPEISDSESTKSDGSNSLVSQLSSGRNASSPHFNFKSSSQGISATGSSTLVNSSGDDIRSSNSTSVTSLSFSSISSANEKDRTSDNSVASPRPSRPVPAREISPRQPSSVLSGSQTISTEANATSTPSANARPARSAPAAPAPVKRSLSTGRIPNLLNTANRERPLNAAKPVPAQAAPIDDGHDEERSSGPVKAKSNVLSRPLPALPSPKAVDVESPTKESGNTSPAKQDTSEDSEPNFRARAHQRKSSGYDSDKLAASLLRQQELLAEGKAPKAAEQISQTKVAHKASFNTIKAKWKHIADDPVSEPTSPISKRPKLVTVKSLSNLFSRSSAISSPSAKK